MTIAALGNAPAWAAAFALVLIALGVFIYYVGCFIAKAGPELRHWFMMWLRARGHPVDLIVEGPPYQEMSPPAIRTEEVGP